MMVPEKFSPEWEIYIMDMFDENTELVDGKPKMAGLLRVAQKVYGEIINEDLVKVVTPDGVHVTYKATFDNNGRPITRVGASDCTSENGGKKFGKYRSSMSESRARSRCYRFLLCLKTVAADEVDTIIDKDISDEMINSGQISIINRALIRAGGSKTIDEYVKENYNKEVSKLTRQEGASIIQALNNKG